MNRLTKTFARVKAHLLGAFTLLIAIGLTGQPSLVANVEAAGDGVSDCFSQIFDTAEELARCLREASCGGLEGLAKEVCLGDFATSQLPLEIDNDDPRHAVFTGHEHTFKRVVTDSRVQVTNSTEFIDLHSAGPGGGAEVPIDPSKSALINVGFTGESRCSEPDAVGEENWCELRILINGVEGEPAASSFPPDTYAFDSTDDGNATTADWEGHAMDRHLCVENKTDRRITIPVQVQWKVTNFGGDADVPAFWLDDWSLSIERSDRCRFKNSD